MVANALNLVDGKKVAVDFLKAHHLLIVGQTGSGKITTTLSLLDQFQHENQTAIVLDPTGEYAQLPNAVTYTLGENAYLEAGKLNASELQEVLGAPPLLTEKSVQAIDQYQQLLNQLSTWTSEYQIAQLPDQLVEEMVIPFPDSRADYHLLGQVYDYATISRAWTAMMNLRERLSTPYFRRIFDMVPHPGRAKTELSFVLKMFLAHRSSHRTLVIDLSMLKQFESRQGAIISYLLKIILNNRLQKRTAFPVNIVLDEAHRYLPANGQSLSHNGIFQILREGRKVHLRMILTAQSPLDLPAKMRSQFNTVLIHRLLSADELTALSTTVPFSTVAGLPTGQAFLQTAGGAQQVVVNTPEWWTD
ncbi:ATP-binding protein [Limosilactobacillus panis]|uniref:ATP-binding protein n=1 Tax=Limosilactobacillus panis TaxID=47493 RepID=UPI001C9675B4|nr:ATP-binding protein [Limosilactobacillus panis]QZN92756.1 ATP-binding protein [Limosilactobacillus panis]